MTKWFGWCLCYFGYHDWDMQFMDPAHPLDWSFKCKRCGARTSNIADTI